MDFVELESMSAALPEPAPLSLPPVFFEYFLVEETASA